MPRLALIPFSRFRHVAVITLVATLLATCALAQADRAVAATSTDDPAGVAAIGRHGLALPHTPTTMSDFMTMVIQDVHHFWTTKLASAGIGELTVRYRWFVRRSVRTPCGPAAADNPFYCPRNHTIYFSARFARKIWLGMRLDGGRTGGDMGVATVIAHEYAHDLQYELGVYKAHRHARQTMPFELEADCLAGVWANNAYHEGILEVGDPEEAAATTAAVGDHAVRAPDHHGTPAQRRAAWLVGYNTANLANCGAYVRNA
jgi:predicted metalloprotease